MLHIRTKIDKGYYISTRNLQELMFPIAQRYKYETMVFKVVQGKIDWSEIACRLTNDKKTAINNHARFLRLFTK